eukprot:1158866-Pelagomonas_calceolata.AAC.1
MEFTSPPKRAPAVWVFSSVSGCCITIAPGHLSNFMHIVANKGKRGSLTWPVTHTGLSKRCRSLVNGKPALAMGLLEYQP